MTVLPKIYCINFRICRSKKSRQGRLLAQQAFVLVSTASSEEKRFLATELAATVSGALNGAQRHPWSQI